ncbi:hypothetical protein DFH08DRAFT_936688 [Mycena albidolilacea]|uniref:Uncharacterized protein n=1 Tax=Mycena albidolilacea TaxID=1033008 RepID=A0AAD7A232_9AGAR|nr:hypothetical protein DFH08DRAFT_936688 [Mycena albidolilacea]
MRIKANTVHFLLLALALHTTALKCGPLGATCSDTQCCALDPRGEAKCIDKPGVGGYCNLGSNFCPTCSGDLVCNAISHRCEAPKSEDEGHNEVEGVAGAVMKALLGLF